ncbi:MAG: glutathione S-transferase family protein [Gammaproteobacteria bacterium]|nr:MAG: glutathione S-transferase family protein [Gammaproteobacteria bacterium]
MNDLILHHYALSPYSEKVRAMLGYTRLSWQSAITPEMPPRPVIDALTGGYQRIPVAQLGADVFCDTHLISQEIARLSGQSQLDPANETDAERAFVKDTENAFFALVMAASSLSLTWKALKALNPIGLARLMWDRMDMGKQARVRLTHPLKATDEARAYLQKVEDQLASSGSDFLFGDTPHHADFAAYHGLWMVRDVGERNFVRKYPRVMNWMNRIRDFGHGLVTEISGEDALMIARDAQPRDIAPEATDDPMVGQRVRISPTDYRLSPSEGTLVGSLPDRLILAREHAQTGLVHVHFPREGYALSAV